MPDESTARVLGRLEQGQIETQRQTSAIWTEVSKVTDAVNGIRLSIQPMIKLPERIERMEDQLDDFQRLVSKGKAIAAGLLLLATGLGAAGSALADYAGKLMK